MSEFMKKNEKEITKLCEQTKNILEKMNIKKEENLSVAKCVEIVGEIHKLIQSNQILIGLLDKQEDSKKTGTIVEVTLHIILSEHVKNIFDEKQIKVIEDFCKKGENVQIVMKLVNWVANKVLAKIDPNNDGKVTKEELTDCCVKCCTCCPGFGAKLGRCWAWICINVCCCNCGDDKIKYEK